MCIFLNVFFLDYWFHPFVSCQLGRQLGSSLVRHSQIRRQQGHISSLKILFSSSLSLQNFSFALSISWSVYDGTHRRPHSWLVGAKNPLNSQEATARYFRNTYPITFGLRILSQWFFHALLKKRISFFDSMDYFSHAFKNQWRINYIKLYKIGRLSIIRDVSLLPY